MRKNAERRIEPFSAASLAIHGRYTEHPLLGVPYGSLQGVTVRPVPCNYYVIQRVVALSERKPASESPRKARSRPAEGSQISERQRSQVNEKRTNDTHSFNHSWPFYEQLSVTCSAGWHL